jgi:hypothetical protein
LKIYINNVLRKQKSVKTSEILEEDILKKGIEEARKKDERE